MDSRQILIIAAIVIILISVVTIYLAPSETIIPIPNPDENITRNNNYDDNNSASSQGGPSQQSP
jgi:hypothetical protein